MSEPNPSEFVYSTTIAKAIEADEFGDYSGCMWVALRLDSGQPVDGDDDFARLEERLVVEFGEDHASEISVVGPLNSELTK